VIAVHNLSRSPVTANVRLWTDNLSRAVFLFGENVEVAIENKDLLITLEGYGYDWIRLKSKGA
jgi:hypothetical protein